MLINISPLFKYRDFRLLYLGQFISYFGNMLTFVALPYQIFHLTHSSLAVGNVGLIQLVPLLISSLWGGALADKVNRKKLLLTAECCLLVTSLLLLMNTLFTSQLWIIYTLAALSSTGNGFHRPVMEGITQSLVERKDMPAISSLNSFKYSVTMIGGPTLAGLILAKYDLAILYSIDVFTYVLSLSALVFLHVPPLSDKVSEPILNSIWSGMRYARSRQDLLGTYFIDFAAMIFGMPLALFPAIAATFSIKTAIGWLYAAPSIGMLASAIFSGWVEKINRHGVAISISASIWGLAIIAFGFSNQLVIACFFLAIAGAADAVSGLFRATLWNQTIPPQLRGRMAGIEMISYTSGPLLGNAEAGFVAAGFGTTASVVSGGVLCILSVAILVILLPKFWRYSADKVNSSS